MMSPNQINDDRRSSHFRHTPLQIIHIVGNFLRIWSVYSMYHYLSLTGASVLLFTFSCLVPSSILFLALQKPWKGRPLSNQQVVPSIINGAITALYFILWGKGLKSCGPVSQGDMDPLGILSEITDPFFVPLSTGFYCIYVSFIVVKIRAILAEYSGAVLGVLSAALYGHRSHLWKKVGGLIAMVASFYLLSQGWAMATYSPFSFKDVRDAEGHTEEVLSMKGMIVSILAGILSALRRVIARRVSLKNQLKRRLNAITITSATCMLFPVAMWDFIMGSSSGDRAAMPFSAWPFLSTILFGIILIFYVDSIAEERLHMVFSSARHLMVAGGCIIFMEIVYSMDFSLLGFIICTLILGFGIHEATCLERSKKGSLQHPDPSNGMLEEQTEMPSLPT